MNDPPTAELTCANSRYAAARCLLRLAEICENGNQNRETERLRAVKELAEMLLGPDVDLKRLAGEE
jgi:hypothetical protein